MTCPASLQIPYLLNIAMAVTTYLPSFAFDPRQTFQLLQKLDLAFSSLLHGKDRETDETLPGFEGGRTKVTITEKVRMRGIVERTRVAVVGVASKDDSILDFFRVADTEGDMTTDADTAVEDIEDNGSHRRWEMQVARVYERTIVDLGAALDANARSGFG